MLRRVGSLGVQGRSAVLRALLRRSKSTAEVGGQSGRGSDASQVAAATALMERTRMEKFEDRFLDLYQMYANQTKWMAAGLTAVSPSVPPLPCHVHGSVGSTHPAWADH
jgi:hypothetical protein